MVLGLSGMRVLLPQFRHVVTRCGSRVGRILSLLVLPGMRSMLHFLHICRLYTVGSRSLPAMAILLALSTWARASSGLVVRHCLACWNSICMRCLAICFDVKLMNVPNPDSRTAWLIR